MSAKYQSLAHYLRDSDQDLIRMRFDQVEDLIRGELPASARDYRAWWSNSRTHSHARHGWLDAGYETSKVDLDSEELIFMKAPETPTLLPGGLRVTQMSDASLSAPRAEPPRRAPSALTREAGGDHNVASILAAVHRYIYGEITELELGRQLRQLWPR
jgi:hypothetical protein